jgi:hypothetical protein
MIDNAMIDYLIVHGRELAKRAEEGDELAKRIINLYRVHYVFPDHATEGLLEEAVKEYQEREA